MSTDSVSGSPSAIRAPDVEFLVEDCRCWDAGIRIPGLDLSLRDFLMLCVNGMGEHALQPHQQDAAELDRACRTFINAGVEALAVRQFPGDQEWVQIGIRPTEDTDLRRETFRRIATLVKTLSGDARVRNFFYMDKSPGMRLRFQAPGNEAPRGLVDDLYAEVDRWRADGLIDQVEPGVYEPECQLFGGPLSMQFVHALFTVDSMFWLDYHRHAADEWGDDSSAWLVSLALTRRLFQGLGIVGWEDIGVWERIRTSTGRKLGPENTKLPRYKAIADEIRGAWTRLETIEEDLPPSVNALLHQYDDAVTLGATRWRLGYFNQRSASTGPRAAAAFYVIFHWNRAGLSPTEQAVLAESLAARLR